MVPSHRPPERSSCSAQIVSEPRAGGVVRVVPVAIEPLLGAVEAVEPAGPGAEPEHPPPVFVDPQHLVGGQRARVVRVVLVVLEAVAVVSLERRFRREPEETETVLVNVPDRGVGQAVLDSEMFEVERFRRQR